MSSEDGNNEAICLPLPRMFRYLEGEDVSRIALHPFLALLCIYCTLVQLLLLIGHNRHNPNTENLCSNVADQEGLSQSMAIIAPEVLPRITFPDNSIL